LWRATGEIEQQHFRGFGCSECGGQFKPSGAPIGTSFDEMTRQFELQAAVV
jgi:hypothetical protein